MGQVVDEMTMMIRTRDVAAQEILRERWEAIESGKLKGRRRLFVPQDGEIIETEVMRSLSFLYSLDESYSSSSSSPLPCVPATSVDKEGQKTEKVKKDGVKDVGLRKVVIGGRSGSNGGTRYAVFLGGFAIAVLLIMTIAICISSFINSGGRCGHDYETFLVPT